MSPAILNCLPLPTILLAIPAYADGEPPGPASEFAVPAPVMPQPSSRSPIWDRQAFELGIGWYNTQDVFADAGPVYTLGLGSKLGDGVLLVRYTHLSNEVSIAVSNLATFQGL